MMEDIVNKIKEFVNNMNSKGVPIPLARDNGKSSLSATLLWISSAMVVVGLIGKWSARFGTIDVENALQFFGVCAALHFGKSWRGKGTQIGDTKPEDQK